MLFGETRWHRPTQSLIAVNKGNLAAVLWDFEQPVQNVSDRTFYTRIFPAHPVAPVELRTTHLAHRAEYHLLVYRTGFRANDAYSAYLEMGAPTTLTATQLAYLEKLTRDLPVIERDLRSDSDGTLDCAIPMNSNDVVLVKLERVP